MGRIARIAALLACLLPLAAPAAQGVPWVCGLSEDGVQLVCVADADLLSPLPAAGATAVVNGTAFPLDPRREYRVDLWSPASEPERVEQLARAVICYRSAGCSVVMAGARWAALVAAQAMPVTARAAPRSR